jgi:hypothetical protein
VIGAATGGNGEATVAFTAPASDGGSTILSYTATSNPGGLTGTVNQSGSGSVLVTGLTNGTAYTFTVTATNAIGTSIPSDASNSVTPATVPDAPVIGTATPGNGEATVSFTAPAFDGGAAITSYTATSNPGGFTGTVNQAGSGSIVVVGLTNGTPYTFTVTATNAVGTSAASAASNSTTPASVPDAPVIGTATAGNAEATVSFTAPASNGGSAITSYTATSTPGGLTGTVNQSGSGSIVVTGLTNGTAYTFTVTATNAIGTSADSDPSNSVTPITVPGAPVIGAALPGAGQATVSFTAPASNGGSVITSYTATSNPGGFTGTVNQAGSGSIVVTGLTNGTAYTFTVTATNEAGTGTASAASNSVTPGEIILTFENEGLAGNEASAASNFNNTNLTASTLTRGAGLTAATNADRFNATNWAVTSIANAVTGNDYMEFTITPNSGAQFAVSAMIFNIQRSATGLSQIALRSSVDGYAADLDAAKSVADNTSTQTFTFSFTQGNSPSPVTYRLYGYSEAAGGTGGIGDGAGNDLIVLGTVISDCLPGNWIGGAGNWSNAANWSCNVVPAATDAITISSGDVTLDTDFNVQGSLALSGTGTLTVNPTNTLTVSGSANFNGRPVTFKSTAAGTASLGQVTGSVTGASNVTVERYIPNNGFRSWRLLSVPVTGTQTIRQAWQEGTANPLPQQNNLPNYGTQITSTGPLAAAQAAGFDNVTLSAALLRWNGSAWTGIASTNAEIDNFPAYFLFIRGERSKGITGANNNTSATTLRTTGTIYTGDQEIGVNTAFALVPNYYPSAINFTALDRTGGVNNVFYIWDSKKQSGSSLGVYQTFSGTANFVPTIDGGSYSTSLPNTTIESGQAFFVTSGAAGTITLKESAKISGTNGNLGFRPSATPAKINSRLYSGDDMLDANVVVFDAAYDRAVDGDDAPKMGNPGANFAIETQNKILAVEGTQQPVNNEAVQFRMWNLQQQAYKLEFAASNITMPGLSAELEDSYLDTRTAIDLSGTTTVNFTVDANEASKAANRFRIVFKQAAPLPVTFISISANRTAAGVKVNWKVAEERNIASYEIERSADGRSFASVGSVAAANAAGYNFTDLNTLSSSAYYRVKSVGTTGAVSYTAIVKVAAGDSKPGYSISPNPAEGTVVNLQIKNQPQGNYSIRLLNNLGQLLYSNKLAHAGGNSTQQINLPAGLIRGVYQVDVIAPDNTKTSQKLLINTNQ